MVNTTRTLGYRQHIDVVTGRDIRPAWWKRLFTRDQRFRMGV